TRHPPSFPTRRSSDLPIEAVGRAPGPRLEQQDGDEVGELEDPEQERRVSLAVDEERRGEVLEPRAGRRRGVAGEVRAEVTVADQPQRSRRARDVRPFGLPRLHGGFLSARTASAL